MSRLLEFVSEIITRMASRIRTSRSSPIVRNAALLYATTVVTSLLGFFYWFIAARMASVQAVGTASAIQSAAQFLAIFCVLGLSTLLVSELASDRERARSMILTATVLVTAFSLVASVIAGLALGLLSPALRPGLIGPIRIGTFVVLGTLSTTLIVLDDSCIGLFRGDLQLRRNVIFAVVKLALLPFMILWWPDPAGTELVIAWVVGLAVSLIVIATGLGMLTRGQKTRLDIPRLIDRRRLIVGHHSLNLSIQTPRLILPVMVATVVGTQANAAFTAALLVVSFVGVIPVHLSTVLFALSPGDELAMHREVRVTMRICLVLAAIAAPFFLVFSRSILGLFGPIYQTASPALIVLGLTILPAAIKSHYVAINRVRGRMQQAAYLTLIGACLEVGLATGGAMLYGITGVALGFLFALIIEATYFSPVVFSVMRKA